MKKIKNIIFDLGGIFIELDYSSTERAFAEVGVPHFKELFTQHKASLLFEKLETGKVNEGEFYDQFRTETSLLLGDDQIKNAWNAMLGRFPLERLDWLRDVASRYKIFLFSNTNIIHYNAFQQIFRESTGNNNFDDFFSKAYYSHELGARKPYTQAFEKIIELENLTPGETLFIDDTEVNIEGAKEAGLQTLLLQKPQTVLDINL